LLTQFRRKDLHIASQYDELDVKVPDGAQYLLLERRLGLAVDFLPPERNLMESSQVGEVRMIRHDLDNVDWQPTSVPVKQQVRQTMGRFGGQDEGTDGTPQLVDVDSSVALSGELADGRLEVGAAAR
jgi:hypothetical protein